MFVRLTVATCFVALMLLMHAEGLKADVTDRFLECAAESRTVYVIAKNSRDAGAEISHKTINDYERFAGKYEAHIKKQISDKTKIIAIVKKISESINEKTENYVDFAEAKGGQNMLRLMSKRFMECNNEFKSVLK